MKIYAFNQSICKIGIPIKLLRIMKLTTFILMITLMHVSAKSLGQRISLKEKNSPLEKVLDIIKQQSGFDFIYNADAFNSIKIDIQLNNVSVEEAVKEITKKIPLNFKIIEHTIVLTPREEPVYEKTKERLNHTPALKKTISGLVINTSGKPLIGATIAIAKVKTATTVTDANGAFNINADPDQVLEISYIGYKKAIIPVNDLLALSSNDVVKLNSGSVTKTAAGTLEITLIEDITSMKEVEITINTGYQRIRPEQSTGAVSVITTKDFESRVSTNFLDGLVNRLPGLMINNDVQLVSSINGAESSNNLFNIRGISTMTANQQPLIVLDGYPTELTLNMIDPNEIKSVTILKDAAAATIYGVRASNGVIVIERKQARQGKPQVVFRATTGFTPKEDYSRYRWDDNSSAISIDLLRAQYQKNGIGSTVFGLLPTFSRRYAFDPVYIIMAQQSAGALTTAQTEQAFSDLASHNNTDDYSKFFLRSATTQTYNLNMSGGSETALYYISANYTDNSAKQIRNGNNRLQLSGRTTLNFSKRFSLELSTNYQEERFRSSPIYDINRLYSFEQLKDDNGNPAPISSGINPYYNKVIMGLGLDDALLYPLVEVNEVNDLTHTINNRTTANFKYQIGNGFDLSFGGVYEISRSEISHLASALSAEARQYVAAYATKETNGSLTYNIPKGDFLKQESANTTSYTLRAQLNYNKRLGTQHSINAIAGAEVRDLTEKANSAAYFGYDDESLLQQPVNYANINNNTISRNILTTPIINYNDLFDQVYKDNRYISGYANLAYTYRDTYSLTGSLRMDQSNLFGTDPKYKYKPMYSFGAAWNIHKESFMQQLTWVKQLKLRVADGFNGNVAKNSLPQVIAKNVLNNRTNPNSVALGLLSYANSSLRWEQTRSFNLGLDYQIFSGISGSLDYYTKKSTDLLSSAFIDPTIGVSPSLINSGTIRNQGLELNLRADWITKSRFNWNTGLVVSRNTSKVLKVHQIYQFNRYAPYTANKVGFVPGYPVGILFAYRWAGLSNTGAPQLKDEQGNIYPATLTSNPEQKNVIRYMGSSIPTVNAGLSNRIDVGNFYFYCMVGYYGGFKTLVPRPDPSVKRPLTGSGNYWKNPGDENNTDIMNLASFFEGGADNSYAYNYADSYVVNGDYLTLADVTASYNLNKTTFIKRLGLTNVEFKLQASNLYTVGLNKYNYSKATGSYAKSYLTPTYTFALFTNF